MSKNKPNGKPAESRWQAEHIIAILAYIACVPDRMELLQMSEM
jgi:hypothetical protein